MSTDRVSVSVIPSAPRVAASSRRCCARCAAAARATGWRRCASAVARDWPRSSNVWTGSDVTAGGAVPNLLDGKAAVVTGGAQGIGLAIARKLVNSGARVVIGDVDGDRAQAAAAEFGSSALGLTCNVTDENGMEALVARCRSEFDTVDVMVNNAGITRDKTMRNMSLDDFRAVVDVHLVGAWLGTRFAAQVMREQGSGSIVNISSLSGKQG